MITLKHHTLPVLLLFALDGYAQTTYQDAMKINAQRDATPGVGANEAVGAAISEDDLLAAYEAYHAQAGFQSMGKEEDEMVLGGTPQDETVGSGSQLTPIQREVIAAGMLSEQEWVWKFLNWESGDVEGFKELVATCPSQFNYLDEIAFVSDPEAATRGFGTGLNLASVLGFNESAIIEGITDWALKQAEEELLQAFLKQWLDALYRQRYLRLMMPTTLNTIKTTDLGALLTNGDLWKASFQKDLDSAPDRLDSLVVLVLQDLARGHDAYPYDQVGASALLFGQLYRGLERGEDLESLLSAECYRILVEPPGLPVSGTPGYAIIHRALAGTTTLLEATRLEKDGKFKGHVDPLELLKLDSIAFGDYWRFVCVRHARQMKLAFHANDAQLAELATQRWTGAWFPARRHVLGITNTLEALSRLQAETSTGSGEKQLDAAGTLRYLELVLDLLDHGSSLVVIADPACGPLVSGRIQPVLRQVKAIDGAVLAQEYGHAISGLIDLTELFIPMSDSGSADSLKHFGAALNKYGGFMVDVLQADSSAQVEEALRKATVGTGGYRVKLTSRSSGTIALFPGAFFGNETVDRAQEIPGEQDRVTDPTLGVFLPIGLHLTLGTGGKVFPDVGLYLQAVDLGAVLSYRLNASDSVSAAPQYSFEMLLSPGGYLTTHLGRSPLVFGVGANLTPKLREVTGADLSFDANAWRVGAFIGVDVTAFHLFSSRRKFGGATSTYRDRMGEPRR